MNWSPMRRSRETATWRCRHSCSTKWRSCPIGPQRCSTSCCWLRETCCRAFFATRHLSAQTLVWQQQQTYCGTRAIVFYCELYCNCLRPKGSINCGYATGKALDPNKPWITAVVAKDGNLINQDTQSGEFKNSAGLGCNPPIYATKTAYRAHSPPAPLAFPLRAKARGYLPRPGAISA